MESVNFAPEDARFVLDNNEGWVALIRRSGEEIDIVNAARVSFGKLKSTFDEKDKVLLDFLIQEKHFAPLEHITLSFLVHCPLYVRGQWMRHRTGCLTGDTIITFDRPKMWEKNKQHINQLNWKGQPYTLEYLYEQWNKNNFSRNRLKKQLIRVYDEQNKKFICSNVTDVIYSGEKDVYEITLADNKKLKLTDNHQVLTKDGWLSIKDVIGVGLTNNNIAYMTKNAEIMVNGTIDCCKSYDWMKQERENKYSVDQIAEHANCSYSKVRYWLKKHNLQFNPLYNLSGVNGKPPWNKGKKGYKINYVVSDEHKQKLKELHSGEKSNFWKGGITFDRKKIAEWTTRQAPKVHKKFNYICQICNKKGGVLHAHHKIPVYQDINLAYDFNNLITVCKDCHKKIHNQYSNLNKKHTTTLLGKYEKIISVKYVGKVKTYDLTIDGENHNFIANGIVVHNSFNEISRRYTEVDMELYTPTKYRKQSLSNKQASEDTQFIDNNENAKTVMAEYNDMALKAYNYLLSMGVCREQARGVLPQNMMTTFYCTMNLRNTLHFLGLRMDKHAQWEIRVYANEIHDILAQYYPNVIAAFDKGLIK